MDIETFHQSQLVERKREQEGESLEAALQRLSDMDDVEGVRAGLGPGWAEW